MGFLEQFLGSCNFSVLFTMVCLENIENKIQTTEGVTTSRGDSEQLPEERLSTPSSLPGCAARSGC